jgi:hypothetical protein
MSCLRAMTVSPTLRGDGVHVVKSTWTRLTLLRIADGFARVPVERSPKRTHLHVPHSLAWGDQPLMIVVV